MTVIARKLFKSDTAQDSAKESTADIVWMCKGSADRNDARDSLVGKVETWDDLILQHIAWERIAPQCYLAKCHYSSDTNLKEGEWTFSIDNSGGSVHVSCGTAQRIYTAPGETAPTFAGFPIGVDRDRRVQGVDVASPALKLTITASHPFADITIAWVRQVSRLVGKVNNATYLGWDAGEVMYIGSTGREGKKQPTQFDHHFLLSENVANLVMGGITVTVKKGHEFIWPWFGDVVDTDELVVKPKALVVTEISRPVALTAILTGIVGLP